MRRLNQSGAVAIISVVIFSIILSIVVATYATTIFSQQHESINYDLSTRAFYAAEAGVQDAIRAIRADDNLRKNGQNNCSNGGQYLPGPANNGSLGDSSGDIGYTCQLIVPPKEVPELELNTSENTNLIPVSPADTSSQPYTLTISWSKDPSQNPRIDDSKAFPQVPNWKDTQDNTIYPVLRISLVKVTGSGANRSDYSQCVYFANPAADANGDDSIDNPFPVCSKASEASGVVRNADCKKDREYNCALSFKVYNNDIVNNKLYVVVQSIYSYSTPYKINLADSKGENTGFNDVAQVDVTARAGSVYRRVSQSIPLQSNTTRSWFNASALVVGDGICKLFTIGTSSSQFNSQCDPSQTTNPNL